jgi:enediyne biosynthesis protein E4
MTELASIALASALLEQSADASQRVIFVDRSAELGVDASGQHAAWCDANADGWPDLRTSGALWLNREGKSFTRVDAPGDGPVADIDNDGIGDLVSFAPIAVARGVRDGDSLRFEPLALPELPKTISRGVAVGDFDGDGFLDAFFGGYEDWPTQTTYPSILLLNEGGKAFRVASTTAEGRTRGVTACDFDEDGDLDLYRSNYRLQPNALFVNDGKARLADEAAARGALATSDGFAGGHSIGACFGDFDNDGRFDLFAGNFAHVDSRGDQPKSRFLRNGGAASGWRFEDLGECGVWYQESYASPAAGDFDNDGDLDLFLTTVYATASFKKPNFPVLFRNDGAKSDAKWVFADATAGSGLESLPPTYQAAWADVNRDGRLDLVTAGKLFMNEGAGDSHWLGLRLRGDDVRVNRDAIGAQVRVSLPDGRTLSRQVEAGTGEGNANSPILHFGLGACAGPLEVEVRWPNGERLNARLDGVNRIVELAQQLPAP